MLTINQISKSFGDEAILSRVSFTVNAGERVGLVGPNGCGKTTLLRIITGSEKPDSGSVRLSPATLPVGYLPQGPNFEPGDSLATYLQHREGDLPRLTARLEALARELGAQPEREDLQVAYDETLAQIEGAAGSEARGPAVLAELGLDVLPPDQLVAALSGGQKARLSLAGVLLSNPQLLLLDEPTNHLDLDMLAWLEAWLLAFQGGALVVSHDRAFLDRVATTIVEIDPSTHNARGYAGNYSQYLEAKGAERERQAQAYSDQQEEIKRLRLAAAQVRSQARLHKGGKADPAQGDKFAAGFFADQSQGTMQKAKNIEKRIEKLLTEDPVEKPGRSWQMRVDFRGAAPSGRDALVLEGLAVGYGERVLLQGIDLVLRAGSHTALVGPNGSGKSTLMRTISGQMEPLAGRVRLGSNVKLGYMAQEQENLDASLNALEALQKVSGLNESEARAFLSFYLFTGDDVFVPAGKLSYGERSRLMLACLVAQGCNLLLLDEPLNHLDIPSRTRFEQALGSFDGAVLAVTHDRYFLRGFAQEIWKVEGKTLRKMEV